MLAHERAQPDAAGARTRPRAPRPPRASRRCRAAAGRAPPRRQEPPSLTCDANDQPASSASSGVVAPTVCLAEHTAIRVTSERAGLLTPTALDARTGRRRPHRQSRHDGTDERDGGRHDVGDVERIDVRRAGTPRAPHRTRRSRASASPARARSRSRRARRSRSTMPTLRPSSRGRRPRPPGRAACSRRPRC